MRSEASSPGRIPLLLAGIAAALVFVWFQWKLLFLAFAGLLVSILLHAVASWIERRTPFSSLVSYLATVLVLTTLAVILGLLLLPHLVEQLSQVAASLPRSIAGAETYLQGKSWGASLLAILQEALKGTGAHLTGMTEAMVRGMVDLVVVLVIGFFGALNPKRYRDGLLSLFPEEHRAKAREVSRNVIAVLHSWLLGQLIPMVVLGIASMLGLWLLGVPLAFILGLITGLLIFMPYIGSISSGLLAILLAFQRSPRTALHVFFLYCLLHLLEGYILTPLVQRRAAHLPPVLTILSQLCLWSFGGILGVAVAAPLAAAGLVLVRDVRSDLSPGSTI